VGWGKEEEGVWAVSSHRGRVVSERWRGGGGFR